VLENDLIGTSDLFNRHIIEHVCFLQRIQSDHKKTPQLISFLFEIRFQRTIRQIKGFKKYYQLDIKCHPKQPKLARNNFIFLNGNI
jgi:hypothetical protein